MTKQKCEYWMDKLEEEVEYGNMMLFEWYRAVQDSFQHGSLTKKEMARLFKMGRTYEL